MSQLNASDGTLTLRINSYGGDVFEVLSLYNVLKPSAINVYIDGVYALKTKLELSEIIQIMDAETWMNGVEAKQKGFADELTRSVQNVSRKTYEEGVQAERKHLAKLDAINSNGREVIINRAKYETFQTIALDLLRAEPRASDSVKVSAGYADGLDMELNMAVIISKARMW